MNHIALGTDIESYVQGSGHIGKDGQTTLAKLFCNSRDPSSKFVSDDV